MAGTVFLMYHELERPGRSLCDRDPGYVRYVLPESAFEDQVRALAAMGTRGASVGEWLGGPSEFQVVITFDDGCESDWTIAAPILQEHGFGATFYVCSGHIGKRGYLATDQLKVLGECFEVGCHSATHRFLPHLNDAELREEVVDAKARLEDIVGRPVRHFSCPGGRWNRRVEELVRTAGYETMATSRTGRNDPSANRFRLARVPLRRDVDLRRFERICRGGLVAMRVQQMALDAAKRSLGDAMYARVRSLSLGSRSR